MGIISWIYTLPRQLMLLRLKRMGLTVGENFYCGAGVFIDSTFCWLIKIGDNVTFADRVYVMAHDASTKMLVNHTRMGRIIIGNRVFIGTAAIILPGVAIGDDVVIGTGSIVTGDIPSGSVARGNPAAVVGSIEDFTAKKYKEMEFYPCFGKGALLSGRPGASKKREMDEIINERFGYIY